MMVTCTAPDVVNGTQRRQKMNNNDRLKRIAEIIEEVDRRAQFGAVVTPTLEEMTQEEMSEIYALACGRD